MVTEEKSYLVPHRAWKKLKAAAHLSHPVYIYGAATYGKTELIRQFLGKSKYVYISCANGGFESDALPLECNSPITVVLDDLSMLRDEAKRQQVIDIAKRHNVRLFMLSRSTVPGWLMPLYIKSGFTIIEEDDLCIEKSEVSALLISSGVQATEELADYIVKKCTGNAYAICFTARKLAEGRVLDESLVNEVLYEIARYILENVISQWDSDITEFLTQTSVVEEFDIPLAEHITGNSNASSILNRISEIGNFLYCKNGVYHLMPVVLSALHLHAQAVYGSGSLKEYSYNAGLYYELHGEVLSALAMYESCGAEDRITAMLMRNARQNPGIGYYYELRKYYFRLNEADIERSPVLMAGMSMLYGMLMQEEKSEYWYEKLSDFAQSATGGDLREAQARLIYLDVSLAHRGSGGILKMFSKAVAMIDKGATLPEFSVTSNMPSLLNGGKDFCAFAPNDREIIAQFGAKIEKMLGRYGNGLADAALAESLYEKGCDTYETLSLISRSQMQTEAGGALEIAFAAVGLQIRLHILHGDESAALETLNAFEKRVRENGTTHLIPNINALRCRIALYGSNTQAIEQWLSEAPDEDAEFYIMDRYRYMTKIRCYIANGSYLKAFALLEKMRFYAGECDRMYISMEVDMLAAVVKYRMGDNNWKDNMLSCLLRAKEIGFIRIISQEGAAVSALLEIMKNDEAVMNQADGKWFNAVLTEAKRMAKQYPLYLKGNIAAIPDFSENALEVLRLQAQGMSAGKIADHLMINIETVKYHAKQNYKKLGASGKADAVLAARNLGIL